MTTDPKALSLPSVIGEETVISLEKAVKASRSGREGFFTRKQLAKDELLYEVGSVPNAIYMLRGGTIRLKPVASRAVEAMPITTIYSAAPDASANRPLLGARYFFSRSRCTLAYTAETPCVVYEITSAR